MTDPRYAAPDVTVSATDEPPTAPRADPSAADAGDGGDGGDVGGGGDVGDGADTADTGNDRATAAQDPQATTELPRTGWESRIGAPSESSSQAPSESSSPAPSESSSPAPSEYSAEAPANARAEAHYDSQATSQSQSQSGSQSQPGPTSGDQPQAQAGAPSTTGPSWSTDETHNFPAYRPQSYPTYPPTLSQTSELPAVGPGGPPPTTAAAYGGPGPGATGSRAAGSSAAGSSAAGSSAAGSSAAGSNAAAMADPAAGGMTAFQPERPRRRAGAGVAGALGLIGIGAAAYGAFALPIQRLGPRRSPYFVSLRELSTQKVASSEANAHSVSFAGGHAATLWWRYGLAGALGLLALLLLVQICVPVLRRAAGALLFLAGLATIVGYAFALHQTNDFRSVVGGIQRTQRLTVSQLGLGVWIAVAGCAVTAVGGLIAAAQSTRR